MAFDAATGQKRWEVPIGRRYRNSMGDGPRSTPTVDGDRVYVLTENGDLACLMVADGKIVWEANVTQPQSASRLPNGHTLVATQSWPVKVVELDRQGKQVAETTAQTYVQRARKR